MTALQDLFSAIESGQTDAIRQLLTVDPFLVNARDASGLSAVLAATYRGRNEIAKLLIDRGARLHIFEASASGAQDRLEQLLHDDPASINSYSADGWTPLHLAAFFGRVNIVHLLLTRGAALNAVSHTDEKVMPLHSALANPHNAAIGQLLIDHGADLNAAQALGYTPLHYAAANGLENIVRTLLKNSVDKSARNTDGKTAYDLAAEKGHSVVAALLNES